MRIYSSLITQVVQIAKCESNLILASKRLAPRQAASSGSAQVLKMIKNEMHITINWENKLIGTNQTPSMAIDAVARGCEVRGSKEFSSIFIYNIIRKRR